MPIERINLTELIGLVTQWYRAQAAKLTLQVVDKLATTIQRSSESHEKIPWIYLSTNRGGECTGYLSIVWAHWLIHCRRYGWCARAYSTRPTETSAAACSRLFGCIFLAGAGRKRIMMASQRSRLVRGLMQGLRFNNSEPANRQVHNVYLPETLTPDTQVALRREPSQKISDWGCLCTCLIEKLFCVCIWAQQLKHERIVFGYCYFLIWLYKHYSGNVRGYSTQSIVDGDKSQATVDCQRQVTQTSDRRSSGRIAEF